MVLKRKTGAEKYLFPCRTVFYEILPRFIRHGSAAAGYRLQLMRPIMPRYATTGSSCKNLEERRNYYAVPKDLRKIIQTVPGSSFHESALEQHRT